MARTVNKATILLMENFEGYHKRLPDGSCQAYLDKLPRKELWSEGYDGLWTIGFGCTVGVYEGLVWSRAKADKMFAAEVAKHVAAVEKLIKVPVNDNQFGAIVSLSYNLGPGGFPTLLKRLNEGDYQGAADAFLMYNKAGGVPVKGLTRRRRAERDLFLTETKKDLYAVSTKMKVSWWTRFTTGLSAFAAWVGSFLNWDTLNQVKQLASDHQGAILLGVAGVFVSVLYFIENKSHEDFEQNRWVPSGLSENGTAVWKEETYTDEEGVDA